MNSLHDENKVRPFVIKEPVKGKDGELFIRYLPDQPSSESLDSVDYMAQSQFVEVLEGQILALKKPMIPHCDGMDKNGKVIKANFEAVSDITIDIGKNVLIQELEDGSIEYRAGIKGIVQHNPHKISVEQVLEIEGDVGLRTGHINYSGDIVVRGSVTNGAHIVCGGNLHICQNIENKVEITCDGNLKVDGGIRGEFTLLKVNGTAEARYLQDIELNVKGKLHVESYAYNAKVYGQDDILISGKQVSEDKHGSIVGGVLNTKGSIVVHSAGSMTNKSKLISGIDIKIYKKVQEARNLIPMLLKKMTLIQDEIGIHLNHPDAQKKLNALQGEEKERVKKKLLDLKGIAEQHARLSKKMAEMKEVLFKEGTKIEIQSFAIGDVSIQIGLQHFRSTGVKKEKVGFKLAKGMIVKSKL